MSSRLDRHKHIEREAAKLLRTAILEASPKQGRPGKGYQKRAMLRVH